MVSDPGRGLQLQGRPGAAAAAAAAGARINTEQCFLLAEPPPSLPCSAESALKTLEQLGGAGRSGGEVHSRRP